jgi:hypothetical protein
MCDNHTDVSGANNPMYGKPCYYNMSDEEIVEWKNKIRRANLGKKRDDDHKKNYSNYAKNRIWLVHVSGKLSHTNNPNDERLLDAEWQKGTKWKQ